MRSFSDDPTTRLIRPAQFALLSTPALEIAETVIRVSRAAWSQTWRHGAEHRVWRAANHDGPDRSMLRLGFDESARLRILADSAGGWVAWTTNPVFVPLASWVVLHRTWAEQRPE